MEHLSTKKTVVDKWRFYVDISEDGYSGNAELDIIYEVEEKRMTGFVEFSDQMIDDFDIPVTQEHSKTVASYIQKVICITESKTYENVRDWANNIRAKLEAVELIFEDFWDDEDRDGWTVEVENCQKFDGIKRMKDLGCTDEDIKNMICGDEVFVEKSNKFKLGDVVKIDRSFFRSYGKLAVVVAIDWQEDCETYNIAVRLESGELMWIQEGDCVKVEEKKFDGIKYMKDHGLSDKDIFENISGDENFVEKSKNLELGDAVELDDYVFVRCKDTGVVVAIDWDKGSDAYNIAVRIDETGKVKWVSEEECIRM